MIMLAHRQCAKAYIQCAKARLSQRSEWPVLFTALNNYYMLTFAVVRPTNAARFGRYFCAKLSV
jgi:hypothetical protein